MKAKRITGLVLAVCMVLSMTPIVLTESAALAAGVTEVATHDELQAAIDAGETAKLTQDITGKLTVNTEAVLDLNGFILRGGIQVKKGGVLTLIDGDPEPVHEDLAFLDQIDGETMHEVKGGVLAGCVVTVDGGQFTMEAGTLTGGSGIMVKNAGNAVMNGGLITGNIGGIAYHVTIFDTDASGGPVFVYGKGSVFTMNGGCIACNYGSNYRYIMAHYPDNKLDGLLENEFGETGGVTVVDFGTIIMEGGSITGNMSSAGGGVRVGKNGTFNLLKGEISENVACIGGGVCVSEGTFNMSGGSLANNKAIGPYSNGGGLSGYGKLTWSAYIDENKEGHISIPIHNTIKITGGSITGNSSGGTGGGIDIPCIFDFELSGGASVTNNTAEGNGGGINMGEASLSVGDIVI